MEIKIPQLSLVVLIGPSGAGKSTFARKMFKTTEVLSSDVCRGLVSDDENDQSATKDAFELLHFIAAKRLAAGKLTVIDATNVQPEARKPLVALARQYHVLPVAIVFNLPEQLCRERNSARDDRDFGGHVIRQQCSQLRRSFANLKREGFRHIFKLTEEDSVNSARIERVPLWNDKKELHGPFDVIGDIHGCYDELVELLETLGYQVTVPCSDDLRDGPVYAHPGKRTLVFLGDIVDRGPRILDTFRLVRNTVEAGNALCVPGNHDVKLLRKLRGKDVQLTHGLGETMRELGSLPESNRVQFVQRAIEFIDGLISHYVLDNGKLVVAHAGLKQEMQGRGSGKVREFCLFGETSGELDEFGLPIRYDWASEYRGPATVVYGHTPVPEAEWLNRTINIDTGCVFGGKLSALRYPEKEIISVDAREAYCLPVRPLSVVSDSPVILTSQQSYDDLLDADDVLGKRIVTTRLRSNVTVREENAMAALEVMSRFATNPKWLIYLPPTMSPPETSRRQEYLEHPDEAFAYFRNNGIPRVICQEKHMGSRAVVVVCRDEEAAMRSFGVSGDGFGIVYSRTGRRFFNRPDMETAFLERIRNAIDKAGFWDEFRTEWFCLDCELMPWSEKAQELLKGQYAAVGASAGVALDEAVRVLNLTAERTNLETGFELPAESKAREFVIADIQGKILARQERVGKYVDAYRRYCWPVNSLDDLKLAPFHVLASAGKTYLDKDHEWHMTTLSRLCAEDPAILRATSFMSIDVTDEDSLQAGIAWWEELTGKGSEGMVVKSMSFSARGKKGLVQPALKCRGREYLRIIYGAEYDEPRNLDRLRSRSVGPKRSLALREFALGVEGLERFVRNEPLRRVHECVFAVLALESEPVDPRL